MEDTFHNLLQMGMSPGQLPWKVRLSLSRVRLIQENIIEFVNIIKFVNTYVSPCQFGFLPNHSTLQQLILFFECLFEKLCYARQVDVIYFDFKKAFDSIVHM